MSLRHSLVPIFLGACILLGGASAAGFAANFVLQLAAIPIIVLSVLSVRHTPMAPSARALLILTGLLIALILIQLIPLPPTIWTNLPGRGDVAEGYRLLNQPLPWLPLSLAPRATIAAALWLLPAIAVLLGILRLGGFRSDWIAWTLGGAAVLSVLIGALQVAGGPQSPWYLYQTTNRGVAVGFFANTNHLATLLLATIPFLLALQAKKRKRGRSLQRASGLVVITSSMLVLVVVGLLISSSLAGLGLFLPVLGASLLLLGSPRLVPIRLALPALAVLGVLVAGGLMWTPLGGYLTAENVTESTGTRSTSVGTTIDAAIDFLPAGSGIGTFVDIYRTHEEPTAVTRTYMNHAHSDYAEILLETGLVGVLLLLLFLLWWVARVVDVWRRPDADVFARAASIASAAILLHSAVDYPLRTAAISAVFALCCAFLTEARPRAERRSGRTGEPEARHLSA